jgi:hypothetical protein
MDINTLLIKPWLFFTINSIDIDCYNYIIQLYYNVVNIKKFIIPSYSMICNKVSVYNRDNIYRVTSCKINNILITPICKRESYKLRNGPFKNTTNPYCLHDGHTLSICYYVPNMHYIDQFKCELPNNHYIYKYEKRDNQLYNVVVYYL